jgi:antitoxin ParD1/3/4
MRDKKKTGSTGSVVRSPDLLRGAARTPLDATSLITRFEMTNIAQFLLFALSPGAKGNGPDMNVSIGERWEAFVDGVVREGRYGSASEVVREGLRLVEEREAKLKALRAMLDASIAAGGEASEADIDNALEARTAQLAKEGF